MEEKEIKINVPEGYEIDKENSTFDCIKFKPIKKELPKTWEEYCKNHPRREGEAWITQGSEIDTMNGGCSRDPKEDRNLLPNQQYAKAMLALCQLIQLRDCYNDGWVPKWADNSQKYYICIVSSIEFQHINVNTSTILAFKSANLRDEFLENFRDLIKVAKPLLQL